MPEDKKKLTRIGVDVNRETLSRVDIICIEKRWPRTVVVREALLSYLNRRWRKKNEG